MKTDSPKPERLVFTIVETARMLGISRGTLRKKLAQYGLD